MQTKRTAYGNIVLTNDYGAICDPRLKEKTIKTVSDALGVEVSPGEIAGLPYVGSLALATNKGVLVHPMIKTDERTHLEEMLKVPVDVGTINCGIPYISTGLIGNSGNGLWKFEISGSQKIKIGHSNRNRRLSLRARPWRKGPPIIKGAIPPGQAPAYDNLNEVSINLKLTTQEVRRAPWKLLYKPKPREYKIQALVDSAGAFAAGAESLDSTAVRLKKLADEYDDQDQIDREKIESMVLELQASFEEFQEAERIFWEKLK